MSLTDQNLTEIWAVDVTLQCWERSLGNPAVTGKLVYVHSLPKCKMTGREIPRVGFPTFQHPLYFFFVLLEVVPMF